LLCDGVFFNVPDMVLERKFRNPKFNIRMEPVIWHNPYNEHGWNGVYNLYKNLFSIEFKKKFSETKAQALFKKYQI
jgi:hypothetical protein